MEQFKIYFNDLTEEAQKRYLGFQSVFSPNDLNHEVLPLAIIDKEEEPENG